MKCSELAVTSQTGLRCLSERCSVFRNANGTEWKLNQSVLNLTERPVDDPAGVNAELAQISSS